VRNNQRLKSLTIRLFFNGITLQETGWKKNDAQLQRNGLFNKCYKHNASLSDQSRSTSFQIKEGKHQR